MTDQRAQIDWREGRVPVSTRFDDPYFSLQDGVAETTHVFLDGNDLPARFRDGFHIAELGFGTGLNFLVALMAFRAAGIKGKLRFTSFEAFPMVPDDLQQALAAYPDMPGALLRDGVPEVLDGPDFQLHVVAGDARQTLLAWPGRADAWFLDGFSPAKNPELWGPDLMVEVARHTATGGSAATYTAAGNVRRALDAAGFDVTRAPGFGHKRHMTRARLR
ncbi:MAG: tRNA (5-methylaminomethyl-2-thiouridine)(34)-methyltransferase MnmD [Alphaproteobacteria bacterium]|jgi:tRNA U34 5-methylaminomethyl-2-thiouridine-forming methyltransferase MnmC|nr:tRNA (5-methylaminomethyl-2-thiouridine)(34)-methyltransferase MnmD [Alphaproteobacteria bacterium]